MTKPSRSPKMHPATRLVPACWFAALVLSAAAPPVAAQSVWALTPYRIEVRVAMANRPELSPDLMRDLCNDLTDRADATVGASWNLAAQPADAALHRAILADVGAVEIPAISRELLKADKVMLVAVVPVAEGYRVAVRELDTRTRLFGLVVSRVAPVPGKLRDAVFRAILQAHAPLARIDAVDLDEHRVQLRVRASALPMREAGVVAVRPGDVFRPVVRFNARDGSLRKSKDGTVIAPRPIEWTYLTVDDATPAETRCRLHTGLRAPLSSRRRGRTEQLALGVVRQKAPTELTLQSRTQPHPVLAGYDVYARPPDSKVTTLLGRTDRDGRLLVPPGDHLLRVLVVKHGGAVLARLPIVPGAEPALLARIANDDERLAVEGIVTGLQEQLVDLVTQREVLLARVRMRIKQHQFDEAADLIDQLRRLPTRSEFNRTLSNAQKAIRSDDPVVQSKIDALFADTQKLVDKHLDPEAIETVWQELRQSRNDTGA